MALIEVSAQRVALVECDGPGGQQMRRWSWWCSLERIAHQNKSVEVPKGVGPHWQLFALGVFVDALGCFFKGAIMSDEWTEKFVERALLRRPKCPFTPIPDFGLTAFDNLQIRIGYKAFATVDTAGVSTNYMLDMTNWLTFDIPACVAPQLPDGRIREISTQRAHEPTPAWRD